MAKEKLTIEFGSREEMITFCTWLCNRAEQDYWEWCDHPRRPSPAVDFHYHSDGGFLADNTIRTTPIVREERPVGPPCQKCGSANTFIEHSYVGYTTWICRDCDASNIKHHPRNDDDE